MLRNNRYKHEFPFTKEIYDNILLNGNNLEFNGTNLVVKTHNGDSDKIIKKCKK